jgi:transcriptional regulator with XRE-family HTH domain
MKFGDYIRQKREANGWTQPEAAAKIDIEQSYLSKMETGKSYPSEDIFTRLIEAYKIDTGDLSNSIFSAELDKLREIKEVRMVVLERQTNEIKFTRSWMIAGLVMMMLGGACLGFAIIGNGPPESHQEFRYKSLGIILPDEPLDSFDIINENITRTSPRVPELQKRQQEMINRIHEVFERTNRYKGDQYVKKTLNGKRRFKLFDDRVYEIDSPLKWLLAPALMLLVGSVGCFFISYRWK